MQFPGMVQNSDSISRGKLAAFQAVASHALTFDSSNTLRHICAATIETNGSNQGEAFREFFHRVAIIATRNEPCALVGMKKNGKKARMIEIELNAILLLCFIN